MTTRRQVADEAGVSVRTVSNVVNGFEHIAPDTKRRVLEAIERVGYRPSEMARSLKSGRSGLIALMLPELDTPYFAELTRAFVTEGYSRGFTVVVDQTDGDAERERSFVRRAANGGLFDGLVLSPIALDTADVSELVAGGPVVLLGEVAYPGVDRVMIDSTVASRLAVEHLLDRGASRIAAIGRGVGDTGTSLYRLNGYREALEGAGIAFSPRLAPPVASFTRAEGARATEALLASGEPFDGIFAFSDSLAHGALRALHESGRSVPGDVAVVGFDDDNASQFSIPTLTTISPDKSWIARTALDRLTLRLSGAKPRPETIVGSFRLIERESTGRETADA